MTGSRICIYIVSSARPIPRAFANIFGISKGAFVACRRGIRMAPRASPPLAHWSSVMAVRPSRIRVAHRSSRAPLPLNHVPCMHQDDIMIDNFNYSSAASYSSNSVGTPGLPPPGSDFSSSQFAATPAVCPTAQQYGSMMPGPDDLAQMRDETIDRAARMPGIASGSGARCRAAPAVEAGTDSTDAAATSHRPAGATASAADHERG